jgi:SAM-dependent methyltransferase
MLPFMRCPHCGESSLKEDGSRLRCAACASCYQILDGVIDTLGDGDREVITPFQRLMQTPLIVYIYERFWRRLGYFLASSRSFSEELKTVLAMHPSSDTPRTLDLACGTGVFTRPLAARSGGVVVGLDLSRPMLRRARWLASRDGIGNIMLVRGSAFRLPFVDGTFSCVNCCGALHLFDEPEQALAEMRRVLTPGGRLCVQTTIRPTGSAGIAHFLEKFIRFGFFSEHALDEMIRRRGFQLVQSERHRISLTFVCR